jgi:hypothetical protein
MKFGGGGLIVIIKLSNFNRDTALMPINTHLTDVELMMTCIISTIPPGHLRPNPFVHCLIVVLLLSGTRRLDCIRPPGLKISVP